MPETPEQYRNRVTSYVAGEDPLKLQAATSKKLDRVSVML